MGKTTAYTKGVGTSLAITGTPTLSITALKELALLFDKKVKAGLTDENLSGLVAKGVNPFHSSVWDFSIDTAGEYVFSATFVSETQEGATLADSKQGLPALGLRRDITIEFGGNGSTSSASAVNAVINYLEQAEKQVAAKQDSSYGDHERKTISLRGKTPYLTHEWTVEKIGSTYIINATPNTN